MSIHLSPQPGNKVTFTNYKKIAVKAVNLEMNTFDKENMISSEHKPVIMSRYADKTEKATTATTKSITTRDVF